MKFSYLAGLSGKLLGTAGVFVGMALAGVRAGFGRHHVQQMQFFHVTESNTGTSDFHPGNTADGYRVVENYVSGNLVGGMPVFNPGFTAAPGFSAPTAPGDVTGANVLEWWTPGSYDGGNNVVTSDGSGPLNVSSNVGSPTNMFPPDSTGTDNATDEETAILSGGFSLAAPGTVTFSIAADDDAFIFVDGSYVGGLGGIHAIGNSFNTFTTGTLTAGGHTIDIFYADQDEVAASLAFSSSVPINPTPEPGSLALLGTGVLAIGGTIRRRMMR